MCMKKHLSKSGITWNKLGCFIVLVLVCFVSESVFSQKSHYYNDFLDPAQVHLHGLLGDEIHSSEQGRLSILPTWNDGRLIKMFSEDFRRKNKTNDWYGEHAGKWMYSTALAVERSGDVKLKELLFTTADELISYQDDQGYLGSYAPNQRISAADYPQHYRSWDVWNLTYMTLGFLKINEFFPNDSYKQAALKIGELLLRTFGEGKADITDYGTRHGYSATIVLEAAVELYYASNDTRYIDFGSYVLRRINEREGLRFFPMMDENRSLELIGDGKIYQSIWNMYAIAKFYELNPDPTILPALLKAWKQITSFHLTPAGGPWGGYGKHLECFNSRVFFSPYGMVETCSTMSWIHFNKQLLRLTGEAKYAQEIEKSVYNELMGARYTNGVDWNYHSFSNGNRHTANFNDCCPSSGALALEELSTLAYSKREGGIACNLYAQSEVEVSLEGAQKVKLVQQTDYPYQGTIEIAVTPQKSTSFPIFVRIPDWATQATVKVNGEPVQASEIKTGEFCKIDRKWKKKDIISIDFPMELRSVQRVERIEVPQSKDNIYAINWTSFARGPLVYAGEGLINGKERERYIPLKSNKPESALEALPVSEGQQGVEYVLKAEGMQPLKFVPYYRTGNREEHSWRTTWLQTGISF